MMVACQWQGKIIQYNILFREAVTMFIHSPIHVQPLFHTWRIVWKHVIVLYIAMNVLGWLTLNNNQSTDVKYSYVFTPSVFSVHKLAMQGTVLAYV
jgi:hypothetical protein